MKKLLLVCAIFALSGCSTVTQVYDSYFLAKYDTNEYALVNAIKTRAEIAQENCGNPLMIQVDMASGLGANEATTYTNIEGYNDISPFAEWHMYTPR
jgi:uncharacterized protein YceK